MGFNSVYLVLQEVFPEVDARLLKAVAIEHSKDADAAVEAILVEVIPYISNRSKCPPPNENEALLNSKDAEDASNTSRTDDAFHVDSKSSDEELNNSSYYDANGHHDQLRGDCGDEGMVSLGKCEESSVNAGTDSSSTFLVHDNVANHDHEEINSGGMRQESSVESEHDQSLDSKVGRGTDGSIYDNSSAAALEAFDGTSACISSTSLYDESQQSSLDGNVEVSVVQLTSSPVQEVAHSSDESSLQLIVPDASISGLETPEPCESFDFVSKEMSSVDLMEEFEHGMTLNTVATRSGQIYRIDLLENAIEDAKCNKKTLFSAMESVMRLMREVEFHERAAEEAKEEAAKGGLDILSRVEDLKQMLPHAREANDMHAGEVYGEKAILATEVRELQSRLLSLSDERDKSLAILEEMRETLEARFAAVERERKAAEQEKLEKEESARKALIEQELIMEKLVEESKILKQQAKENSELQEFLIDRGHVVDVLQGEISVICQDVKVLKEKFDERVPLDKSFSSSQTSCILASSSSSLKSLVPDQAPEQANPPEIPKGTSPSLSDDEKLFTAEERTGDDCKELVDDGWELFDNREFLI